MLATEQHEARTPPLRFDTRANRGNCQTGEMSFSDSNTTNDEPLFKQKHKCKKTKSLYNLLKHRTTPSAIFIRQQLKTSSQIDKMAACEFHVSAIRPLTLQILIATLFNRLLNTNNIYKRWRPEAHTATNKASVRDTNKTNMAAAQNG